jgi:predicted lipoprotein with Yx(FWY)xxD motif
MATRHRIVRLTVALVVVLAACGGAGQSTTSTAAGITTTTAANTTTTASGAGVHLGDTSLGPVLVDSDGMTLYVFTRDTEGESVCYDSCAAIWPPVPGDTPVDPVVSGLGFGTIERDDGTTQLTVGGMPLYLYAGDTAPGDVNGQGVEGVWFVVDATGSMVAGSPTADPSYEGY